MTEKSLNITNTQCTVVINGNINIKDILNCNMNPPFDYESFRVFALKKLYIKEYIFFHEFFLLLRSPEISNDIFQKIITEFLISGATNELNVGQSLRKPIVEKLQKSIDVLIFLS
jgi:hypothetical protein